MDQHSEFLKNIEMKEGKRYKKSDKIFLYIMNDVGIEFKEIDEMEHNRQCTSKEISAVLNDVETKASQIIEFLHELDTIFQTKQNSTSIKQRIMNIFNSIIDSNILELTDYFEPVTTFIYHFATNYLEENDFLLQNSIFHLLISLHHKHLILSKVPINLNIPLDHPIFYPKSRASLLYLLLKQVEFTGNFIIREIGPSFFEEKTINSTAIIKFALLSQLQKKYGLIFENSFFIDFQNTLLQACDYILPQLGEIEWMYFECFIITIKHSFFNQYLSKEFFIILIQKLNDKEIKLTPKRYNIFIESLIEIMKLNSYYIYIIYFDSDYFNYYVEQDNYSDKLLFLLLHIRIAEDPAFILIPDLEHVFKYIFKTIITSTYENKFAALSVMSYLDYDIFYPKYFLNYISEDFITVLNEIDSTPYDIIFIYTKISELFINSIFYDENSSKIIENVIDAFLKCISQILIDDKFLNDYHDEVDLLAKLVENLEEQVFYHIYDFEDIY